MTRVNPWVVAAAGSLLLLGACGSDGSKADDSSSTATTTPTAPATTIGPRARPSASPPGQLVDYEDGDQDGATLTDAGDVTQLTGAPDDFKTFIAKELAKDRASSDDACTEKPQIYVSKVNTGGWASGGHFVPQCGGYATLWARPGGTWKEVWSGQELTDCKTLKTYKFPVDVVGTTCLDGTGEVPYTGADG